MAHVAVVAVADPGSSGPLGMVNQLDPYSLASPSSSWQIIPCVPPDVNGTSVPSELQGVFDPATEEPSKRLIPGGFEIQSAVRLWKLRVFIQYWLVYVVDDTGVTFGTVNTKGKTIATCTVEPAPGAHFGSDKEFDDLAALCSLSLDKTGDVLQLSNN